MWLLGGLRPRRSFNIFWRAEFYELDGQIEKVHILGQINISREFIRLNV